jgi:hypothetical protein
MLVIDFKLDMTTQEYEQLARAVADEIARVPGLIRKTWTWNPHTRDAGGVYLFEDQASLERYLEGSIIAQLRGLKQVSEVRARPFDILEQPSLVTRGIPQPAVSSGVR